MATIDELARDFLDQKRIAVAGVSGSRDEAANDIYRKLRDAGTTTYALNPNLESFEDAPCYPDVASLPEPVDGVVVVNRPELAEQIMDECIATGVPRVWLHCMVGTQPRFGKKMAEQTSSVSEEAVRKGRAHGITVIPGACPMMFCEPVDFGHTCIRGFLRLTGALKVE